MRIEDINFTLKNIRDIYEYLGGKNKLDFKSDDFLERVEIGITELMQEDGLDIRINFEKSKFNEDIIYKVYYPSDSKDYIKMSSNMYIIDIGNIYYNVCNKMIENIIGFNVSYDKVAFDNLPFPIDILEHSNNVENTLRNIVYAYMSQNHYEKDTALFNQHPDNNYKNYKEFLKSNFNLSLILGDDGKCECINISLKGNSDLNWKENNIKKEYNISNPDEFKQFLYQSSIGNFKSLEKYDDLNNIEQNNKNELKNKKIKP